MPAWTIECHCCTPRDNHGKNDKQANDEQNTEEHFLAEGAAGQYSPRHDPAQ